jgi:hypothetical protein
VEPSAGAGVTFTTREQNRLHDNHRCYHMLTNTDEPPSRSRHAHLPRAPARGRADQIKGPLILGRKDVVGAMIFALASLTD